MNDKNKNNDRTISGIYIANRGDEFKTLISSVLKKGLDEEADKELIELLLSDKNIECYSSAFTSESIDPINNYQVFEQLGDLSGNKFIVSYFYNRFPQLKCSEGVKIVARLRINYGAKQSFSKIAQNLGFWNFITETKDIRQREMKKLLEDVFEAFIGVTEYIVDKNEGVGTGYQVVYKILEGIFDEMEISLEYDDLYDAKTRLKELCDLFGEER